MLQGGWGKPILTEGQEWWRDVSDGAEPCIGRASQVVVQFLSHFSFALAASPMIDCHEGCKYVESSPHKRVITVERRCELRKALLCFVTPVNMHKISDASP